MASLFYILDSVRGPSDVFSWASSPRTARLSPTDLFELTALEDSSGAGGGSWKKVGCLFAAWCRRQIREGELMGAN